MADWPQSLDYAPWTGMNRAQLPAESVANTKTGYTELIASTDRRATAIQVGVRPVGAIEQIRLDIAVGGAGSEKVIIPDLIAYGTGNANSVYQYMFPIAIPSGTRISARYQSNITLLAAAAPVASVELAASGWESGFGGGPTVVSAYGVGGSTSYGTSLTASATPGVFGTLVQLVAATDRMHRWFVMAIFNPNTSLILYYPKLSKGAGGSEKDLFGGMECASPTTSSFMVPPTFGFPVTVKGGERLAASLAADQANKTLSIAVYGA